MKKILCYFFVLLICDTAYSQNEQYRINGKTPLHLNGEKVMLFTFNQNEVFRVDTAIITNGEFLFNGNRWDKEFSILTTGNYPDTVRSAKLVLEPGIINVHLDTASFIQGTPLCDNYQEFLNGLLKRREINQQIEESKLRNEPVDSLKGLLNQYPDYVDFMKLNMANVLGKELFREDCQGLYYQDFFDIYELADSLLRQEPKILLCHEEKIEEKKKKEERTKFSGNSIIDFTLTTVDGEQKKLSDFVGEAEYVIFDFWASWCGPCIQDFQYFKTLSNKYDDTKLRIVGISLDTKEQNWRKAIEEHELTWPQLCNLDGGEELKAAYSITGIPFTILADKSGTIIIAGYPAQVLVQFMDQLLN